MPVTKLFTQGGRAITQNGRAILCDECPCGCYKTFYLDTTKPEGGDGKSWETAFNDMNTAALNAELLQARFNIGLDYTKFVCLRVRGCTTYVPEIEFATVSQIGLLKIIQDESYTGWMIDATAEDRPFTTHQLQAFKGYYSIMLESCKIKLRNCGIGGGYLLSDIYRAESCNFEFYMQDGKYSHMHSPLLYADTRGSTILNCNIYCMTTTRLGLIVVGGFENVVDNEINVWFNDAGETPVEQNASLAEFFGVYFYKNEFYSPNATGNRIYFNEGQINLTNSLETICIGWNFEMVPYLSNRDLRETIGIINVSSGYSSKITYKHCNFFGFDSSEVTLQIRGTDRDQHCRYEVLLGEDPFDYGCGENEYTCAKLVSVNTLAEVLEEYAEGVE